MILLLCIDDDDNDDNKIIRSCRSRAEEIRAVVSRVRVARATGTYVK